MGSALDTAELVTMPSAPLPVQELLDRIFRREAVRAQTALPCARAFAVSMCEAGPSRPAKALGGSFVKVRWDCHWIGIASQSTRVSCRASGR